LLFARIEIGVIEIPTQKQPKTKRKNGPEIFFYKLVRIHVNVICFAAEEPTFGGGDITSNQASQYLS